MPLTEKKIFLSEDEEDTNIEVIKSTDADGNYSVTLNITIFDQEYSTEIKLHRNALKGLTIELLKHL